MTETPEGPKRLALRNVINPSLSPRAQAAEIGHIVAAFAHNVGIDKIDWSSARLGLADITELDAAENPAIAPYVGMRAFYVEANVADDVVPPDPGTVAEVPRAGD